MAIENILNDISISRRLTLIERANKIRNILLNKYVINPDNTKVYYEFNTKVKLFESLELYKKMFDKDLKKNESTLFLSYILISDDYNFIRNCENYGYDLNKISKLYDTPIEFIELRLANIRDLNNLNKKAQANEPEEVSIRKFR